MILDFKILELFLKHFPLMFLDWAITIAGCTVGMKDVQWNDSATAA